LAEELERKNYALRMEKEVFEADRIKNLESLLKSDGDGRSQKRKRSDEDARLN
jgi:hypothetical protein